MEGDIKEEEWNINHMQKQKERKKDAELNEKLKMKLMKKGGCVGRNKGKLTLLLKAVSSYQF